MQKYIKLHHTTLFLFLTEGYFQYQQTCHDTDVIDTNNDVSFEGLDKHYD